MTLVRTESSRKERRAARVVARYATRTTPISARENYEPGIAKEPYRKRNSAALVTGWVGGFLGALFTVMLGCGTVAALSTGHVVEWDIFGLISGASVGPMAALFGTGVVLGRKPQVLRDHVWATLSAWLRERYAIEVAPESRVALVDGLLAKDQWGPGEHTVFKDTAGKEFKLLHSAEGCWVEEVAVPEYVANDYQPAGTPAAATPAHVDEDLLAVRLPREAGVLHARGQELLATATKRALSIESEHVVKRVREDYRALLHLHGELATLGEVPKVDSDALVRAMVALNGELDEVLAQERTGLSAMLHAQLGYIENRSLSAEPGLTLPARGPSEQGELSAGQGASAEAPEYR